MYANYYVIRIGKKPGRKRTRRFSATQVWQRPPKRNSQHSAMPSRHALRVRIHRKGA